MIQLLFGLVFIEAAVVVTLLFRSPVRKMVVHVLDLMKRGRGSLVARSVGGTLVLLLGSSLWGAAVIRRRSIRTGLLNHTDEILFMNRLFESSLMGFVLFLALITDRLHYYIKELDKARSVIEAAMERNQD